MKNFLKRFLKYSVSGGTAFAIDLTLLFILVSFLEINYLISVGAAFLFATSVNYTINKVWGFRDTKVSIKKSYLYFMSLATLGVLLTVTLVGILVERFEIYYLLARIFVAGILGIFNFAMNYRFTFRM
ncbi:MAG: GtrA family protein [Nanoarchaeota archaeon]